MATFEIEGPDGRIYEVEAPSREAALSAFQQFQQPTGGVSVDPAAVRDFEARLGVAGRGAADVALFGGYEEAAARLRSMGDSGTTYADELERVRAQVEADIQNYPGARMIGQIGGGVVSGLVTGGPLMRAASMIPGLRGAGALSNIGRGTVAGGIEGAAYGFGSGEGVEDRLQQAAQYGLLGSAIGAGVPVASEVAGMTFLRPLGGALNIGNEARASNTLLRALEDAGMTPQQIDDALAAARAQGQDVFTVADAMGITGRRTLAGTTQRPGAARTMAEGVLEPRQQSQTERLSEYVQQALDARNTRAQQEAAARLERGLSADINYTAAREAAQPVDVRGALRVIDERIGGMQGTTIEGGSIDDLYSQLRRRLAGTVSEEGQDIPAELSDFNRVANFYSDLADMEQVAIRDGATNRASAIRQVKEALGESLENASPDWRTANANFSAASRIVDAVNLGQAANARGVRASDVADQVKQIEEQIRSIRGLTDDEAARYVEEARQAFRTGYANRDLAAIEAAQDARNIARSQFMSDRQRANYNLLANDPAQFMERVGREDIMAQTRQAALGGSPTAQNIADQAMVEGGDIGILASLASGNIPSAVTQGAARLSQAARGANEGVSEAVARALLSGNTDEITRRLLAAQRNQALGRVTQSGIRGGLRGLLADVEN